MLCEGAWVVTTMAGAGWAGSADGSRFSATFNNPVFVAVSSAGTVFLSDSANNKIRMITATGVVTTFAGSGSGICSPGIGTAASIFNPAAVAVDSTGLVYVVAESGNRIMTITPAGYVSILAGSGNYAYADGLGTAASFFYPDGIALDRNLNLLVADGNNKRVRFISPSGMVSTLAGSGSATFIDARGTAAAFGWVSQVAFLSDNLLVMDGGNARVRMVTPLGDVSTIAGSGEKLVHDGFGTFASFAAPVGVAVTGAGLVFIADSNFIRQLMCVPCPASYFCFYGAPVLCPAGSFCPMNSINATLCPTGSFSNAGASNCTQCPAGSFTSAPGSSSCQQCPGGHYCRAGISFGSRLRQNCGKGFYCPDGSSDPTPCPHQEPPLDGWGALQVQGPAFLVDTARCLNQCFWNFTSGDGMLSKC